MPHSIHAVPRRWLPFLVLACSAASASAESAMDSVTSSLRFDADEARAASLAQDAGAAHSPGAPAGAAARYGMPGQWWLGVGGGVGIGQTDGEGAVDGRFTLTTSLFLVENFEFLMDWSLWGYTQDGPDTFGASWSFLFRLHFPFDEDNRTTVFVDGGVGIMGSLEEVPDHGTNVNFLPTIGVGLSHQLGDGPARIVGGVRWHHISNARIDGEENNPSRDGAMFYLAYTFPI